MIVYQQLVASARDRCINYLFKDYGYKVKNEKICGLDCYSFTKSTTQLQQFNYKLSKLTVVISESAGLICQKSVQKLNNCLLKPFQGTALFVVFYINLAPATTKGCKTALVW